MPQLAVSLLGPPHATYDGRSVVGVESNKVWALLAQLVLEADRPHQREALIGLLWPEQPEAAARHNLRQALANLRQAIHDDAATPPFLLVTRTTIQFNRAADYYLDVAAFSTKLDACGHHAHQQPETCTPCMRWRRQAVAR
jgi:DNA-binding SARP family transcriptional activator